MLYPIELELRVAMPPHGDFGRGAF